MGKKYQVIVQELNINFLEYILAGPVEISTERGAFLLF